MDRRTKKAKRLEGMIKGTKIGAVATASVGLLGSAACGAAHYAQNCVENTTGSISRFGGRMFYPGLDTDEQLGLAAYYIIPEKFIETGYIGFGALVLAGCLAYKSANMFKKKVFG